MDNAVLEDGQEVRCVVSARAYVCCRGEGENDAAFCQQSSVELIRRECFIAKETDSDPVNTTTEL